MKRKFTLLLFLAAITYQNVFVQPLIRSQKVFGGSADDFLSCMTLTKDGGYILGGSSYSDSSGSKTENSRGSWDYWIVKLDSTGKIQWDKTIGGVRYEFLKSLQQTKDGGYILGGYSYSEKSGDKTEDSRGDDYWLVKLDGKGNIQWDKTIGGDDGDYLQTLQQINDGGYILGGYSSSNKSGDKTANSRGEDDYWLVKLDGKGNIQWDKTIGGSDIDRVSYLEQTSDGGYILGGASLSSKSGEKTENSRGGYDYWVVKLDNSGNIQWDKTIGGDGGDYLQALQQTIDGGYILGGYSWSNKSDDKTGNSRGEDDYWLVKLDGKGNIQWDKTIGGSDIDWFSSLQQTSDGGYILGGASISNKSGEKTENNRGSVDYWVVKLNSIGNIQWDKTIGGNFDDEALSIKEIDKDRYVVTGDSYSGISGDKKRRSRGEVDYWLVALDARGISNTIIASSNLQSLVIPNVANKKGFSIYPNPAKDILHIQTSSKVTFSLTNQAGQLLFTKTIIDKGEINISALPAGLYFLKNNTAGVTEKIIVTK